jgi:hypothetical protein
MSRNIFSPTYGKSIVQGQYCRDMISDNTVFLGTVMGPSLLSRLLSAMNVPIKSRGGHEPMFLKMLNDFRGFDRRKNLAEIQDTLQQCRDKVFTYRGENWISFGPSKKYFVNPHPIENHGPCFDPLGLMYDIDLAIGSAIDSSLKKTSKD